MRRLELVKNLIREEIQDHKPLVRNACQNEIEAFQKYLEQRKEQLLKEPLEKLEAVNRGLKKAA